MLRRIVIKGSSGVGKTTLSRELSRCLGVPHVELDALHHGPNWQSASPDLLRERVNAALDAERGWVVDGNYSRKLANRVIERAQLIVWLDLPLSIALGRLARRTASRLWRNEELWNGSRESLGGVCWPAAFGATPCVRLRSPQMVRQWAEEVTANVMSGAAS